MNLYLWIPFFVTCQTLEQSFKQSIFESVEDVVMSEVNQGHFLSELSFYHHTVGLIKFDDFLEETSTLSYLSLWSKRFHFMDFQNLVDDFRELVVYNKVLIELVSTSEHGCHSLKQIFSSVYRSYADVQALGLLIEHKKKGIIGLLQKIDWWVEWLSSKQWCKRNVIANVANKLKCLFVDALNMLFNWKIQFIDSIVDVLVGLSTIKSFGNAVDSFFEVYEKSMRLLVLIEQFV